MTELPEEAVEALARAYDREAAAQKGEPDPWLDIDLEPYDTGWRQESLACARAGLEAALPHLALSERELREALEKAAHNFDLLAKVILSLLRRNPSPADLAPAHSLAFCGAQDVRAALAKAPAPERTVGCVCQSCRREYQADLIVPDDVWAQISPSQMEGAKTGGLLCPSCIMERIVEKGIWAAGKAFDAHAERTVAPAEPVAWQARRKLYGEWTNWGDVASDTAEHFRSLNSLDVEVRALYASPPALPDGWRTMDSAPKEQILLGWGEYRERDGFYPAFMRWNPYIGEWTVTGLPFYPTHWQLPPAAPLASAPMQEDAGR